MISQQLLLPLVIVGLVALTLTLSGVVRRYQQHQAGRRALVQRMENAIQLLEEALAGLQGVPLQPELTQLLRRDILDRYRMIGQLTRDYSGLTARLEAAEAQWRGAQACSPSAETVSVNNEVELRRLVTILDELRDYLATPGPLQPLPEADRRFHITHLGERAADVVYRYFDARYQQAIAAGMPAEARRHLQRLIESLLSRGPDTEHVRRLYRAAQAALSGDNAKDADVRPARHAS